MNAKRLAIALLVGLATWADAQEPITLRMMAGPSQGIPPKEATDPRSQARRAVFEAFHRANPGIRIVNAGGLELAGPRAESMFLMSMAGDTAPDVFYVNFRQYYSYIDQGFCRPLDDFLARDPGLAGRINPTVLSVLRSYDGQIYAIPWFQVAMALYFRKDHFLEAGLDPGRPPADWDQFIQYGRKLVESRPGRYGFGFNAGPAGRAYHWSNFVWQAGGEVVQPAERGFWRTAVNSPQGARALDFYRRMVAETWTASDGKTMGPMASISPTYAQDILDGKVSMWFSYTNDVVLNMSDLNPALLGIAALPAGPAGRANEINAGMWAINSQIKEPAKLEACWKFIQFFGGEQAAQVNTQRFVELGLGNLVSPVWLRKFGHEDILAQVDPSYVAANELLFQSGKPEPYGRNTQQVYVVLDNALDRAVLERKTPASEILADIAKEMDAKLLGYTPQEILTRQRAWATGILLTLVVLCGGFVAYLVRNARKRPLEVERLPAGINRSKVLRFVTLCLIPAGLSLAVWAYYPLLRGLVIAFQDYRIVKGASWAGLDNFIAVFTQPIFWRALANSFLYVGLSLVIGFFIPVFLAISLNEIPRARVFFRTVFYLPAMTSGIVIALLWRQFYDPTDAGLLNSILAPGIHLWNAVTGMAVPTAHNWLGNPSLAMFAVVLPGIWAGAGPGSILYLAALKNIPDERYEAADLDGASWVQKLRWITLPGLKPIILINLLGVFIAGFKAMESIFVLTGGGPLYATHTIGLEVWTNAFMFLKFGYATAAAWVMGAILVGFTVFQIRTLLQMRFSTAKV